MKAIRDLSRKELEDFLEFVVTVLWADDVDEAPAGERLGWVPNREWSPDELDLISVKLQDMGLVPDEPKTWTEAREQYLAWLKTKSDSTP